MASHITTYYYMGFAYMMSHRYVDAIKALSNILLYINRTKQYHTRSASYDIIVKKNEQMFALLAVLSSLCPYKLEENLHSLLMEKHDEKVPTLTLTLTLTLNLHFALPLEILFSVRFM